MPWIVLGLSLRLPPLSELDMKLHLMKHIAEDIHLRVPPATSVFPAVYERTWSRIIDKWLQNVARPAVAPF